MREEKKRTKLESPPALYEGVLPREMIGILTTALGEEAPVVMNEMAVTLLEDATPAPPLAGRTQGDYSSSYSFGGQDRRPGDALSYDIIEEMMKCGPIIFIMEMKIAALMSVWRSPRSWEVVCPDEELKKAVEANLKQVLPRAALDFLRSSLIYGTSFSELVWEMKTPYQLGISKSRASAKTFAVSKVPYSCNPETIDRIQRTKDGSFNGFVQFPRNYLGIQEIVVPVDQALVIPYRGMFRNLWGDSWLKPLYPLWFWYEVAIRAWMRYMQRQGTPVAVCYAPSRAQVLKPGTTTRVNAMTWGLAVAGNVGKSDAAVLPSDVDPNTNQALWRLEYLRAEDRGDVFAKAIELLTQMMIRAGLAADRAFTQESGGTGSRAIGEVHAEATALHNELVLIEQLAYINQYWLRHFSIYNRGNDGPPIWLETEGLDPAEKERLSAIMNIAGNAAGFQEALMMIDWEELFELSNIPTLSEREREALKEKLQKEALDKQKAFLKNAAQAKPQTGSPAPANIDRAFQPKQNPSGEGKDANAEKLQKLAYMIANGEYRTILLSEEEFAELVNIRAQGLDVAIETDEEGAEVVKLWNPFHVASGPRGGQFASKKGGAGGGGLIVTPTPKKGGRVRGAIGGIARVAGASLGLVGLGIVGLAILGAATPSVQPPGEQTPPEPGQDNMPETFEEKRQKAMEALKELEGKWPKFQSEQDATDKLSAYLRSKGLEIPDGLRVTTDNSGLTEEERARGVPGYYNYNKNELYVDPSILSDLERGDPLATHILSHEIAHADQSVPLLSAAISNATMDYSQENKERFVALFEGQNELVNSAAMSSMYGNVQSAATATAEHDRSVNLRQQVQLYSGQNVTPGETTGIGGYDSEASAWAGMALAVQRKTGQSALDYATQMHKDGNSMSNQLGVVKQVFPERVQGNSVPTVTEITRWLEQDYNIDAQVAYRQLLEEAATK